MKKFRVFSAMPVIILGILGLIYTGCASIMPMNDVAIEKYILDKNPGNFRKFQYYVSRDIVLTYRSEDPQSTIIGRININRDIIQLLSSTRGEALSIKTDADGNNMLGIGFENNENEILWFVQDPRKPGTYFYLAYTDERTQTIDYGGHPYTVTYERAKGASAAFKRFKTPNKAKKEHEKMEPILLYEEIIVESEQRRNLPGRDMRR